jgi:hypothetical protein
MATPPSPATPFTFVSSVKKSLTTKSLGTGVGFLASVFGGAGGGSSLQAAVASMTTTKGKSFRMAGTLVRGRAPAKCRFAPGAGFGLPGPSRLC